jgi:arylsulfatase A-like enzyme
MTNVLLITTDQHRADSIGAYGNPVCATPNLDRLATEGTRFSACRTQNPFCQPSRATILTGTMPSTHGVIFNGRDLPDDQLERSFAAALSAAGVDTALFGKAHFATTFPFLPTGKLESVAGSAAMPEGWTGPYAGFDHVELLLFGHMLRVAPLMGWWNWAFGPAPFGLHYGRWLYEQGIEHGNELLRLMQPEAAGTTWDATQTWPNAVPEEVHPTTWIADRAVEWLRGRADSDRPWMTWVSFTDPHHPMDPPARWFDRYSPDDVRDQLPVRDPAELEHKPPLQTFFSQGTPVEAMSWANPGGATYRDDDLARMVAGYYAMVSQLDHNIGRILAELDAIGAAEDTVVIFTADHGEHLGDHSQIFKSPIHYEGLLRVPLIVRGPGFTPDTVVDDPVGTIDITPTVFEATGVDAPAHLEGRPLTQLDREWVLTEDDFDMAVGAGLRLPLRTITTTRWKIDVYLEQPWGELYDLADDPGELVNRWDDPGCAAVKDDLMALVREQTRFSPVTLPTVGLVA